MVTVSCGRREPRSAPGRVGLRTLEVRRSFACCTAVEHLGRLHASVRRSNLQSSLSFQSRVLSGELRDTLGQQVAIATVRGDSAPKQPEQHCPKSRGFPKLGEPALGCSNLLQSALSHARDPSTAAAGPPHVSFGLPQAAHSDPIRNRARMCCQVPSDPSANPGLSWATCGFPRQYGQYNRPQPQLGTPAASQLS